MIYQEVVKQLKKQGCKCILVTGAHRAGTTFSGFALSQELGIAFFKEENIKGGNLSMLQKFHKHARSYVLQAPGFSDRCHQFPFDAVVYINRNPADVMKSMERLSDKLIKSQTERTLALLVQKTSKLSLPELKLKAFNEVQAPKIKNAFVLDYESWKDHPLFIPKEERKNFHIRQITKRAN